MKTPKKTSNLKVIVVLFCSIALLTSGIIYYFNEIESRTILKQKVAEKDSVLSDLNDLKKTYDEIIVANKSTPLEVIQERDKVIKSISDLEMLKYDDFSSEKYRSQVKILQGRLKFLSVENGKLKEENTLIAEERDNTKKDLQESEKSRENLKEDLVKAVEKGSKLVVSGTTVVTFKLKNSGDLVVTDKASRVDGININFEIAKNEIAKPIDKVYYIQIVNSENTVLGDANEGVHQYKSLTYSMTANVSYQKKTIHISENFLGNKFTKGTYYVNIYDKEELVDECTFILK